MFSLQNCATVTGMNPLSASNACNQLCVNVGPVKKERGILHSTVAPGRCTPVCLIPYLIQKERNVWGPHFS